MKYLLFVIIVLIICSHTSSFAQTNTAIDDIDNNIYNYIKIGNQYWMTENLKVTRFSDGTPLENILDDKEWWHSLNPAYCWMGNNKEQFKVDYGALYNWYAVNSGKLCPIGWRVPTDSEWQELVDFLGGENIVGDKLKIKISGYWKGQNYKSSDSVGFYAKPGGLRYFRGFYSVGINGTWWSSTEYSESSAWYRTIDYKFNLIERYYYDKSTGFSVRCMTSKLD